MINYKVNDNNKYYKSIVGVLYNNDISALLCYPKSKKDRSYVIPDSVNSIYYNPADAIDDIGALYNTLYLEELAFPNNEKFTNMFSNCHNSSIKKAVISSSVRFESIAPSEFKYILKIFCDMKSNPGNFICNAYHL